MESDAAISFKLNDKSPLYRFRSGKSYIKAFKLPRYNRPYIISVKSYIVKDKVSNVKSIVKPMFMFLDKHYRKTRIEKTMILNKENAKENSKLEGYVEVNKKNKKDRYLVLYTTKNITKSSFGFRRPHALIPLHVGKNITVVNMKERKYNIPFGYEGKISLSILYQ